jgi:DNA polymerase I-like protein with 3'-5' exonuclease and polymerase domains
MSILECVTSRFPGGQIVEADWSQLEIVYAAHISGDETLRNDIRSGKDLHCQNAALISEYTYEELLEGKQQNCPKRVAIRKKAKSFSFQLGYGAGAQSIAEDTGADVKEVQAFIDAYYARYWRLKEWQEENIKEVKREAKYRGHRTVKGIPAKSAYLVAETARRYQFVETDAPDFLQERGISTSFSPTNIKNYPVQGGATGDIVPLVLGKVVRALKTDPVLKDKALLIGTVHDSIIVDCCASVLDKLRAVLQNIMQAAPEYYHQQFGIIFDLELPCEVTWGKNWKEAKE